MEIQKAVLNGLRAEVRASGTTAELCDCLGKGLPDVIDMIDKLGTDDLERAAAIQLYACAAFMNAVAEGDSPDDARNSVMDRLDDMAKAVDPAGLMKDQDVS